MNRTYTSLGRMYPKAYQKSIQRLLDYSGSSMGGAAWLGRALLANLVVLLVLDLLWFARVVPRFDILLLLVLNILATVLIQVFAYIAPYYSAERRAKVVENVLPSFYQLIASYMRSGMTPYQALKSASKKEFGVLKEELDIATSRALGTQSFSDALLQMTTRIKSDNLKRSTELMVRGMDSGGSLARLLEESAANLIENKSLRREIIATSRTYTLMVVFAVLIGAPLLLSISTRFNERIIDLTSQIGEGVANIEEAQLSIFAGGGKIIDPSFLYMISILTVAITSLISSVLVGIIMEGKEKYGLKYAIIFVPVSLLFFHVFRIILGAIL